MQDREIINDLLGGTKASINCYTTAIVECSNQQLRSTLQTLRNEAEQFQYQLYQMAEQKGYYMPAPEAQQNDIQKIKTGLTAAVNSTTTGGSNVFSGGMSGQGSGQQMGGSSNQQMSASNNQQMSGSSNQNMSNSKSNAKNRH